MNNFTLKNDNIINIMDTFGIFEIHHLVNNLLKPLTDKLRYIPTLIDVYNTTKKKCVFISYNFTRSKVEIYSVKSQGNVPVNDLIQRCCIIPIIFKTYIRNNIDNNHNFYKNNDNCSHDTENMYIDYTFIDDCEYEYGIKLYKKEQTLLLKTNIKYQKEQVDFKEINIIEYIKQLLEALKVEIIKLKLL